MSLSIPLTTATADYQEFGGGLVANRGGYLFVGNGPVDVILLKGKGSAGLVQEDGPYTLTAGQYPLDPTDQNGYSIVGLKIRASNGSLTSPAQTFYGALFNSAGIQSGIPFTGTLSTAGDLSTAGAMITGDITAAGSAQRGSGYSVSKGGTGIYVVTFTTTMSAQPCVIATLVDPSQGFAGIDTIATTGFTLHTFNLSGVLTDAETFFVATPFV